jgi:hypothetical protein
VGEERVLLEDHVDVAPEGRDADHVAAVEEDLAAGRLLEADHPQGGGLATARRAEQGEELALGDPEIDVLDGPDALGPGGELLLHPDQLDRGQAILVGDDRAGARLDPRVCHRLVPCLRRSIRRFDHTGTMGRWHPNPYRPCTNRRCPRGRAARSAP